MYYWDYYTWCWKWYDDDDATPDKSWTYAWTGSWGNDNDHRSDMTMNTHDSGRHGHNGKGNTAPASSQPASGSLSTQPAAGANANDWELPCPLDEAEMCYRLRTLKATPIEYDCMESKLQGDNAASKWFPKVLKHWGKPRVFNDARALLSMMVAKNNVEKGQHCEPGTPEFALAKCCLSACRGPMGPDGPEEKCYCLPMMFVAGCKHKPSFLQPRKFTQDWMCQECSLCWRCRELLSCNWFDVPMTGAMYLQLAFPPQFNLTDILLICSEPHMLAARLCKKHPVFGVKNVKKDNTAIKAKEYQKCTCTSKSLHDADNWAH